MRLKAQHRAVESVFDEAEKRLRDLTPRRRTLRLYSDLSTGRGGGLLRGSENVSKLYVNPDDQSA